MISYSRGRGVFPGTQGPRLAWKAAESEESAGRHGTGSRAMVVLQHGNMGNMNADNETYLAGVSTDTLTVTLVAPCEQSVLR